MTEAASQGDVRRAWLDEDEASLSAARVAKHRPGGAGAAAGGRGVPAGHRGCPDTGADGTASGTGSNSNTDTDRGRAVSWPWPPTPRPWADRIGALPRIPPRRDRGRERQPGPAATTPFWWNARPSTAAATPLAPPMRMWADGEVIRGEAYFTAPYEGAGGAACTGRGWPRASTRSLGCAQGASGAFGYTGDVDDHAAGAPRRCIRRSPTRPGSRTARDARSTGGAGATPTGG